MGHLTSLATCQFVFLMCVFVSSYWRINFFFFFFLTVYFKYDIPSYRTITRHNVVFFGCRGLTHCSRHYSEVISYEKFPAEVLGLPVLEDACGGVSECACDCEFAQ